MASQILSGSNCHISREVVCGSPPAKVRLYLGSCRAYQLEPGPIRTCFSRRIRQNCHCAAILNRSQDTEHLSLLQLHIYATCRISVTGGRTGRSGAHLEGFSKGIVVTVTRVGDWVKIITIQQCLRRETSHRTQDGRSRS